MTSRLAGKVAVITALDLVLGTTVEHQAKRLLGRAPALQPLAIRIVEGRRSHQHG